MRAAVLFAGVAVWLVGALTGEAMAFIGAGLCAAALAPELSFAAVKMHWRGLVAWLAYSALSLASASWALISGFIEQPTTRREKRSRTTARYSQPSAVST